VLNLKLQRDNIMTDTNTAAISQVDMLFPAGFELEKGGGDYIKMPKVGETLRFVIAQPFVVGYEWWISDTESVRSKTKPVTRPDNIRPTKDGKPGQVKQCLYAAVIDLATRQAGMLTISQKTIQEWIYKAAKGGDITLLSDGDDKACVVKIDASTKSGFTNYSVTSYQGKVNAAENAYPTKEEFEAAWALDLESLAFDSKVVSDEDKAAQIDASAAVM
jgi:hypothetical protein